MWGSAGWGGRRAALAAVTVVAAFGSGVLAPASADAATTSRAGAFSAGTFGARAFSAAAFGAGMRWHPQAATGSTEVRLTWHGGQVAVTVLPTQRCDDLWLRGPEQSFELTSGTYRFPVAAGSRVTVSGWCGTPAGSQEVTVLDVKVHRAGVQVLRPRSWWR